MGSCCSSKMEEEGVIYHRVFIVLENLSFLIKSGEDYILVDTGYYSSDLENLKKRIGERNILGIIITHWHEDHTKNLRPLLTYLNSRLNEEERKTKRPWVVMHKKCYDVLEGYKPKLFEGSEYKNLGQGIKAYYGVNENSPRKIEGEKEIVEREEGEGEGPEEDKETERRSMDEPKEVLEKDSDEEKIETLPCQDHLKFFYTPGHTNGDICILDTRTRNVYLGDLIQRIPLPPFLCGCLGLPSYNALKTDKGDPKCYGKLIKTLKELILTLDNDYGGNIEKVYLSHYCCSIPYWRLKLFVKLYSCLCCCCSGE